MKLEKCLFDVHNAKGEYLGQSFLALFPNRQSKIISAAHVVKSNADQELELVDRTGRRITIPKGAFVRWQAFGEFPVDISEVVVGQNMGGIPVAPTINPQERIHYPVSPTHPRRTRNDRAVVGIMVEINGRPAEELGRSVRLGGIHLPLKYDASEKTKKGDSGSPLLNRKNLALGVITNGESSYAADKGDHLVTITVDGIAQSLGIQRTKK